MPASPSNILILGGTGEARALATRLESDGRFHVITSLAGRTRDPNDIAGQVRAGGFGGVEGLKDYIAAERITLLVDATHPFAVQISANAADAGRQTGITCYRLERPAWQRQPGDMWTLAENIEAAARAIPKGARALVTVGRQDVAPFLARSDIHVVARMIEPPTCAIPDHGEVLLARPPFAPEQERALMEAKRITALVTKNSGGDATYAKIEAARELGLPVIMIERPGRQETDAVSSVEQMLVRIEAELG